MTRAIGTGHLRRSETKAAAPAEPGSPPEESSHIRGGGFPPLAERRMSMRYLSSGRREAPGRPRARLPQLLGSAILASGLLIAAAGGALAGHSVIEIGVDSTAASFAGDIEVEVDWGTTYTNRTVVIKNTASQPVRLDGLTSSPLQGVNGTSFSRLSDSGGTQLDGGGSRSIQYSFSRTGSPGVREAYFTFTAVHLQGN